LISISDGPVGNGTGIPYMYLTPLDYVAQDLAVSICNNDKVNIDINYWPLHIHIHTIHYAVYTYK